MTLVQRFEFEKTLDYKLLIPPSKGKGLNVVVWMEIGMGRGLWVGFLLCQGMMGWMVGLN